MIPVSNQLKNVEVVEQPSLCPRMIVESERIIGQCDDVEAIKQAIYNILNTERYQYIIFSWDYGVELKDLFGKPIDYVMPEVERRITEALVQDDRIDSCDSFEFEKKWKKIAGYVRCTYEIWKRSGTEGGGCISVRGADV